MLATVEEFRAMVPGAASRMTDEEIEDFIRNLERFLRGLERSAKEKRRARLIEEFRKTRKGKPSG